MYIYIYVNMYVCINICIYSYIEIYTHSHTSIPVYLELMEHILMSTNQTRHPVYITLGVYLAEAKLRIRFRQLENN